MLIKLSAMPDLVKDVPLWRQLICYPEKLKLLTETTFEHELILLPDILVEKEIPVLKGLLLSIFHERFDTTTNLELTTALERAQKAHDKTGEKRDSNQPYFHHVLMTTILSWTYAHAFLPEEQFDKRNLLLSMLYHDTIEDTQIFETTDPGKQMDELTRLHDVDVAISVGYLTKMTLHVSNPKLKEAYLAAHYSTFLSKKCPATTRFYKCCDRIANFADFKYSPMTFFKKKYAETHEYFEAILFDSPEPFRDLFWAYVNSQNDKYGGRF